MRKQDYLLLLIKSLSANEKRYFKGFCKTQSSGGRYLNLFNLLENLETYNAKEIAEKLLITTTVLADDKEYLQEVLLRSLRLFHENSSPENKLQYDCINAGLLYKKGFIQYAENEARKVLEKAVKNEYYLVALNVTRLLSFAYKEQRMFDKIKAIEQQETELLEAVSEYTAMIHLLNRLMEPAFMRKGFDSVKDIDEHELFKRSEKSLKGNRTRLCHSEIKIFYYRYVKPDKQKALQYSVSMYKLLQKEAYLRTTVPAAYFNIQAKLSMLNYEIGKYKEAMFYINSLLISTEKNELGVAENVINTYNNYAKTIKMTLLTLTHQFKEAAAFGKRTYKIKDEISAGETITFLFDYALALFHTGNYDHCHEQLQLLLSTNTKERLDTQLNARILFIMLQFQFKNYNLIAYQVKNLRAWKKRTKVEMEGVDEFLTWLYRLGKSEAKHNLHKTFPALKKDLQQEIYAELDKTFALKKWVSENSERSKKQVK